jgi:uncharacterized repeat protein (TIGR03803 family)
MTSSWVCRSLYLTIFTLLALMLCASSALAQTESVVYSFSLDNGLLTYPYAGVIEDGKGNLYGTTYDGGSTGNGSIYKVAPNGTETILYSFSGSPDGANPEGRLLRDSKGNFYGTTYAGGANGYGAVFKLAKDGTETVLHSFSYPTADGWGPKGAPILDKSGNLYGTTTYGGTYGGGTIFELAPSGEETILYNFGAPGTNAEFPSADLVRDSKGTFYGTTSTTSSCGTVFSVTAAGVFTLLHTFLNNGTDGCQPADGVVRDPQGNLYGATHAGGIYNFGSVFKVTRKGTETVLLSLSGGDGGNPFAGVTRDSKGNIYGTAAGGGIGGDEGYGTVFEIQADGIEKLLHVFTGQADGGYPESGLLLDHAGNLYGTTVYGGANLAGTVYKVVP